MDDASKRDQLQNLINRIEENLRASRTSGLAFVDPRNFKSRLQNRQNHVVCGRRGAGKSSLISSLAKNSQVATLAVNLEDYKDISFPNIILHALAASFGQLQTAVKREAPLLRKFAAWRLARRIKSLNAELKRSLQAPDSGEAATRTRTSLEEATGARGAASSFSFETAARKGEEREVSQTILVDKLNALRTSLPYYKEVISEAADLLDPKPLFLVLDDFYFVPKSFQAEFVDFFHRLTKGTSFYIKVATIRHRSRLYIQSRESYIGVELGHDVFEIDMDYALDNFADLQVFMRQLLVNAAGESEAPFIDELFSGDGLNQLCLASGGVPRDFLSLFVRLAGQVVSGEIPVIGKIAVNEAAIANHSNKIESLKTDSAEEREVLEHYLTDIKAFVYAEKRTNAFLVAKPDLESFPHERQAIRELVDLRLLHLVEGNTSSAPSDGRRYEAYMIDVGLYDNSRPRNFAQLDPGGRDVKSRKDAIRAAPRLDLQSLRRRYEASGIQATLQLTEA